MNWLEERHFKRCPPRYGPRRAPSVGDCPINRFLDLITSFPETAPEYENTDSDYETIIWHKNSSNPNCIQVVLAKSDPGMYIHCGARYTWAPSDFSTYGPENFEGAISFIVRFAEGPDWPDMEAVIRAALLRRYAYAAR